MTKDDNEIDYGKEIVTTKSVTSIVLKDGMGVTRADVHNGEAQPFGHVFLADWDGWAYRHAKGKAANLDGITAIFESSEGSHHGWNLCVAPPTEQACRLVVHEDDCAHVRAGIKRGYWRLRHSAKEWDYKDDVYKDPPELKGVVWNMTDVPQSNPHMDLLRSMYDLEGLDPEELIDFTWVGDSTSEEEYETLTDREKERFRGEVAEEGELDEDEAPTETHEKWHKRAHPDVDETEQTTPGGADDGE